MRERIDLSVKDDDTCTGISQQCPPPTIKIEKFDEGLRLFGVLVGNNCQVSLPAFGILFLFIGITLTIVAFKGPEIGNSKEQEIREETSENIKILGPVCIIVGLLMLAFALWLKYLTNKAVDKQTKVGFYCPVHGDFYPLSPSSINPRKYSFTEFTRGYRWWPPSKCMKKCEISSDTLIPDIPICPHGVCASNRSSFNGQHVHISNPNPNTVIITATPSIVSKHSPSPEPDCSISSTRSLSVPMDVVSFPSYRSRSNPPTSPPSPTPFTVKRLSCPTLPEIRAVSPLQIEKLTKFTPQMVPVRTELKIVKPVDKIERSPYTISNSSISSEDESKKRKSVSILLPPERYQMPTNN